MDKSKPPKHLLRFFEWFCDPKLHRFIEGDLHELYQERVEALGKKKADFRFGLDVLLLFRPGIIRPIQNLSLIRLDMFQHNFLITWRGFMRHKTTFLINLAGLSAGLACAILIYLWVNDESHIDKIHHQDQQLYQVMHNLHFPERIMTLDYTPIPLAKALEEELPEVESALEVSQPDKRLEGLLSYKEQRIIAEGIYAGENYFDLLSFPLVQGSSKEVLADKNNVVLSESLAKKIFPKKDNIIGESLRWKSPEFERLLKVAGIFKDLPANSRAQFDFLLPIQVLLDSNGESREWYSSHAETFVRLKKGTDPTLFSEKIAEFMHGRHNLGSERSQLFVQRFSDKYLYNYFENGQQAGGRIAYVRLFSFIGLFILLIACINFMNLSTAQASRKMKEIGVKKTIGANRSTLIGQFLGEALLVSYFALILAVMLVLLLLPQFNLITGKQLSLWLQPREILTMLGVVTGAGLLAGSYPALYLSGLNAIAVLKGKRIISFGEQWIRKGLVVFQFALSVLFIIGVLIVNRQVAYIQNKHLGYEQDNVLTFERKGRVNRDSTEIFLANLKEIPGVVNASSVNGDFIDARYGNASFSWEGMGEQEQLPYPSPEIGFDFIETMGMEVLAGRSFSKAYLDDFSKIMINEAAAKLMKMEDPVGKNIKFHEGNRQIIGVVKDFNLRSLHQVVEPLFFRFRAGGPNVQVKIKAGMEKATIAAIKDTYQKFHVGYPLDYAFIDADYQQLHETESRVATLSKYFSGLAILISCLGLLGLTMFTVERRSKEVGIRKVLGANVGSLVALLSREFMSMILLGIIIAVPISYLMAKNWLNNYAYRIDLQWWIFVVGAILTMLIAWATVGMQTLRAAMMDPVSTLKEE